MASIDATEGTFSAKELRRRAEGVLLLPDRFKQMPMDGPVRYSDLRLNPELGPAQCDGETRSAAVLVPIIEREREATVLLTQRTEELTTHAGQIAFPGGKTDGRDGSPLATALREAREEIGLQALWWKRSAFWTPIKRSPIFELRRW